MTTHLPRLEWRAAMPCVVVRARARITDIGPVCSPIVDTLFEWMAERGVMEAGPVFFRYVRVDMDNELDIDVGVPVQGLLPVGDERVRPDVLPAGHYAMLTHVGPYDGLMAAVVQLLAWGKERGLRWQAGPDLRDWVARLEFYPTNPAEEPDASKWVSELAFLVEPTASS